jgi:peptidoglycan/xylan/chitin deacetylase (PgdA/CDA1 family)
MNMVALKTKVIRALLNALYYSGSYKLFERSSAGVGIIFTLHRIRPKSDDKIFSPNRILDITPEFLDQVISHVLDSGYDIIDMDQVRQRLLNGHFEKKFICFTFDDGYIDHFLTALPIFEKYRVPFTIYVTPGFSDGTAVHWWQHLEDIIANNKQIELQIGKRRYCFRTNNTSEKLHAFNRLYWLLRAAPHISQKTAIDLMLKEYAVDSPAFCKQTALTWEMVLKLSEGGLATIGAHTINHYALSKLSEDDVAWEASESRSMIAHHVREVPQHFAYPYGDDKSAGPREFGIIKDLGFTTATTTRKGVIFPEHVNHLHALPRISLNGEYQNHSYLSVFLSGAPFALLNRFQHLNVY